MQHREYPAKASGPEAPAGDADRVISVLRIKGLEIGSGAPKVVASITGKAALEVVEQAEEIYASADVDIAELRLDHLSTCIDTAEMVALVKTASEALAGKPLLVTFRSKAEGGERDLCDADYFALYHAIMQAVPIDLLDIEMMKPQQRVTEAIGMARQKGIAVILSNHEFESTPSRKVIVGRLLRQQTLGADILKIATMPRSPEDVMTLMSASVEMKTRYARQPLLTMAMGALGITTRLAGELTGSALTYASIGAASAPGQLVARSVKTVLGIIDQGTRS